MAAGDLTKDKARQLEADVRMAPRAGSALTHVFIYHLQKLPKESAGPLLKAIEEARYARFIFQAQTVPKHTKAIMSRCQVIRLPFLSKRVVLANMQAKAHDAKTADQLVLWDGTLDGTIQKLGMKDTLTEIRRDLRRGLRGLTSLFQVETLNSLAFHPATHELFDPDEKAYLGRAQGVEDLNARKRIALFIALSRPTSDHE